MNNNNDKTSALGGDFDKGERASEKGPRKRIYKPKTTPASAEQVAQNSEGGEEPLKRKRQTREGDSTKIREPKPTANREAEPRINKSAARGKPKERPTGDRSARGRPRAEGAEEGRENRTNRRTGKDGRDERFKRPSKDKAFDSRRPVDNSEPKEEAPKRIYRKDNLSDGDAPRDRPFKDRGKGAGATDRPFRKNDKGGTLGERFRPKNDDPSGDRPFSRERDRKPDFGDKNSRGKERNYSEKRGSDNFKRSSRDGGDSSRENDKRPYKSRERTDFDDRPRERSNNARTRKDAAPNDEKPFRKQARSADGQRPEGRVPTRSEGKYKTDQGAGKGKRTETKPEEGRLQLRKPKEAAATKGKNQYQTRREAEEAYFNESIKRKDRKNQYDDEDDDDDFEARPARKSGGVEDKPLDLTAIIPLNKYIAHSGLCSRRDAAVIVKQGTVKVNGILVTDPGHKVTYADEVTVGDKRMVIQKGNVYILLNKPKDYITTNEDPQGRRTVMDLLQGAEADRLYPIGRLDRNTSGVLLITNDGDLAQKLAHPSNNVKKVYHVVLDKMLTKADFEQIMLGLELEDGKAIVDEMAYLEKKNELGVEIHSGKNRIVRRIFEHLGYEVVKLDRVMYAGLTKKNVPRGKWRYLNEKEVVLLKHFKPR